MAEEGVGGLAGETGKQLGRQVGPLPLWAWGAAAGGALLAVRVVRGGGRASGQAASAGPGSIITPATSARAPERDEGPSVSRDPRRPRPAPVVEESRRPDAPAPRVDVRSDMPLVIPGVPAASSPAVSPAGSSSPLAVGSPIPAAGAPFYKAAAGLPAGSIIDRLTGAVTLPTPIRATIPVVEPSRIVVSELPKEQGGPTVRRYDFGDGTIVRAETALAGTAAANAPGAGIFRPSGPESSLTPEERELPVYRATPPVPFATRPGAGFTAPAPAAPLGYAPDQWAESTAGLSSAQIREAQAAGRL